MINHLCRSRESFDLFDLQAFSFPCPLVTTGERQKMSSHVRRWRPALCWVMQAVQRVDSRELFAICPVHGGRARPGRRTGFMSGSVWSCGHFEFEILVTGWIWLNLDLMQPLTDSNQPAVFVPSLKMKRDQSCPFIEHVDPTSLWCWQSSAAGSKFSVIQNTQKCDDMDVWGTKVNLNISSIYFVSVITNETSHPSQFHKLSIKSIVFPHFNYIFCLFILYSSQLITGDEEDLWHRD